MLEIFFNISSENTSWINMRTFNTPEQYKVNINFYKYFNVSVITCNNLLSNNHFLIYNILKIFDAM